MDQNLFLQMLMGQPAGEAPLGEAIARQALMQAPVDSAAPTASPTPEKTKAPAAKKSGLTPEQWQVIQSMLQKPGDKNPPATPSAPIVKGDAGQVKPLDVNQFQIQPQISPLWAAILGLGR